MTIFPANASLEIRSISLHSCAQGRNTGSWSLPHGCEPMCALGPLPSILHPHDHHAGGLMLQILFRAKDLDPEPGSHMVRGNHTQSVLLAGLRKYVLYELQVLAFTRIGNGVPSMPLILERTKDDGTCVAGNFAGLPGFL